MDGIEANFYYSTSFKNIFNCSREIAFHDTLTYKISASTQYGPQITVPALGPGLHDILVSSMIPSSETIDATPCFISYFTGMSIINPIIPPTVCVHIDRRPQVYVDHDYISCYLPWVPSSNMSSFSGCTILLSTSPSASAPSTPMIELRDVDLPYPVHNLTALASPLYAWACYSDPTPPPSLPPPPAHYTIPPVPMRCHHPLRLMGRSVSPAPCTSHPPTSSPPPHSRPYSSSHPPPWCPPPRNPTSSYPVTPPHPSLPAYCTAHWMDSSHSGANSAYPYLSHPWWMAFITWMCGQVMAPDMSTIPPYGTIGWYKRW